MVGGSGDVPTLDELPLTGEATYSGHAIGNVAALQNDAWKTYVAAGDLTMDWNFASRSGNLAINNFDPNGPFGPLNVSGQMNVPGQLSSTALNQFGGTLTGNLGNNPNLALEGGATGSFMRNGLNNPAAGVAGNWHAGNNVYSATGIFAGGKN